MSELRQILQFKPILPEMIKLFYSQPNNLAGGVLHIVLDDGNVDDNSVLFCCEEAGKSGEMLPMMIIAILGTMSETERRKLYENNWEKI